AEDGMRGFHVTGVQACALPICSRKIYRDAQLCTGRGGNNRIVFRRIFSPRSRIRRRLLGGGLRLRRGTGPQQDRGISQHQGNDRSEERRVGKESAYVWCLTKSK